MGMDVEGFVGNEPAELDALDQWRHAHRVVMLARHKFEPDQVAERIRQRQDFGRPTADRTSYGLAAGPPFAPWPWRWTFTTVPSTIAYSRSGSPERASKIL